ncbi:sulfite oxidase [Bradyrhizobium sp. LHD-71]|uniref:sulfite oxidase n=1 Tax=Bradyrhizobium sp. LHD-71 TaxID=3072141 RepID=UPI00280F9597|nr:sulfite oxidase [Bradyrhizobium sp. LHD-71]MDQ8731141.1 sulfite oxidase [Bradyrhizobium sp. LHD-71]
MPDQAQLRPAALRPDDISATAHSDRFQTSRRMLLGSSLIAIGAAASLGPPVGNDRRFNFISTASAQSATPPPAALSKAPQPFDYPGKDKGLALLGDRPLVAETPESLLNDDTTPTAKFFIRNNGQIPEESKQGDAWSLKVEGDVEKPLTLSIAELKSRFTPQTLRMVMECGGNGRSFYQPAARGNPWTNGGAGCAEWTGVKLADVLKAAGLKDTAKFTGHYGADPHLSGDTGKDAISRGMPIEKAMEPHSMIVWAMNGEPLPHIHGGPLRLVIPGWPGSLSSKWLTRVLVRKDPHDGQGMGGTSYRVPTVPIVPGSTADGKTNFTDMTSMPTRSIITSPANGARFAAGTRQLPLRGAAWAGDHEVQRVDVSFDAGQRWHPMEMTKPKNRYDWVRWTGTLALPSDGYFELWVRATDSRGVAQPHIATNWNPQGYGANPFHRIAVLVG